LRVQKIEHRRTSQLEMKPPLLDLHQHDDDARSQAPARQTNGRQLGQELSIG
jgi:hypothetical protein